jgi:hypothetical protein
MRHFLSRKVGQTPLPLSCGVLASAEVRAAATLAG